MIFSGLSYLIETIYIVVMTNDVIPSRATPQKIISAWFVHLFTASAAIIGLYTLYAVNQGEYLLALRLMVMTIFIDSVDGTMARFVDVKTVVPRIDGALLDNIVDYLNYVITPAFFLLVSHLLPGHWNVVGTSILVLSSAYQFTQSDAKTEDHFFKGFPSYWNLVVFYLFMGHQSEWLNLVVILFLSFMVFVPIKYLYLSRLNYVTSSRVLKFALIFSTLVYIVASLFLLDTYPKSNKICVVISWGYGVLYLSISLFRTFVPMPLKK